MKTIKSFKLLLIALVVFSNVFSQTNIYKPFPNGYASWNVTQTYPLPLNYFKYVTSSDTLIGVYTYKKVMCSVSPNNPFSFGPFTFKFGYRNDSINKKVYYLDVTGGINKDTLWYDFNLNVGDTLKETFAYTNLGIITNNQRRIVSSIDSVLICGSYYKQFNFDCAGGFETSLIEGVGFKDKFDRTGYLGDCPFEPYAVYSTGFSTCDINSLADFRSSQLIKLFPNPAFSELKINASFHLTEYLILNNVGTVVLKGSIFDKQSIDVSSLSSGLHIIKILDKSGNSYQSKFIKQ
ncbi:MAG: T9SS type A sorting domain-containing protein [Bacteroidia bacterium]